MKNLIEKISSEKINPYYDAQWEDVQTIYKTAANEVNLICLAFRFGYMQGRKATKAEIKQQTNNKSEEWRDIKNFKGMYQVSTLGRVRIADTWTMVEPKMKHGILKVALVKNNRCSILDVHQLVAETFIPKVEGKTNIVHIDGNYENNRVENLKWATSSEYLKMTKVA